jgi:hypothetical protein
MIASIQHKETDYVPLSFMIFAALRNTCGDRYEFKEKEMELGLDAAVEFPMAPFKAIDDNHEVPGLPISFDSRVKIREWREDLPNEPNSVLHKAYETPGGILQVSVNKTEWPYGDHIPFFDDYIITRARKPLIQKKEELKALQYLLVPPTAAEIKEFKQHCNKARDFADKHGLLKVGLRGVGLEAGAWLCGLQELVMLTMDDEEFVAELVEIISEWNMKRMEIFFDQGIDLFVRRAWYEGPELFSPALFQKFVLPYLKKEIEITHQAGSYFGYILTSNQLPIMNQLKDVNLDVIIGVDPIMGKGMDLKSIKVAAGSDIALWGGINGPITMEQKGPVEVEEAVDLALDILGPGGGFIMSPVDNIHDGSKKSWDNIHTLINHWKKVRNNLFLSSA